MALARMLNNYADRYIQTGSATPVIHVVTTVGFGGYVYHSFLHWLESSRAEKIYAQQTETLQSQVTAKQEEIEGIASQRKAIQAEVAKSKAGTNAMMTRLKDLETLGPKLDVELKEIKDQLETHVNSPPAH